MKKFLGIALFSIFTVIVHGIHTQSRRTKNNVQIEDQIEEKEGKTFYRGQLVHSAPAQIM
jgi:hypothetical protein